MIEPPWPWVWRWSSNHECDLQAKISWFPVEKDMFMTQTGLYCAEQITQSYNTDCEGDCGQFKLLQLILLSLSGFWLCFSWDYPTLPNSLQNSEEWHSWQFPPAKERDTIQNGIFTKDISDDVGQTRCLSLLKLIKVTLTALCIKRDGNDLGGYLWQGHQR